MVLCLYGKREIVIRSISSAWA